MTLRDLGERGLIERVRRRLGAEPDGVLVGVGDDAAVVAWTSPTVLVTTDTLIEDVHFRRATTSLRDLGAKALAVNLSDIAAMGGAPCFAVIALALPPATPVEDVDELYAGIAEMATPHGVALVGGDTCACPGSMVVTITVLGQVGGAPLRRSGARPGDAILMTGALGTAAAGLQALERGAAGTLPASATAELRAAHRRPTPRVREGQVIRASGWATAMIDVSDGLATDLGHIARESGVGAEVHVPLVPVRPATRDLARILGQDLAAWTVSGGEDYELLVTVAPGHAQALGERVVAETGTPTTCIGEVRPAAEGVRFVDPAGRPLAVRPGFDHFA